MELFYIILPNSASTFLSICNNRNPKHTRSVYHYITEPNRTSEPYRTGPFRNPSNSRNTDLEAENTNLKDDLRKALESTQIQSEKHETEVTYLRSELSESHKRSDEARTRSDTIIMQLTQQLERTQMQLEDLRETKTLWQRVRSVFIHNSA